MKKGAARKLSSAKKSKSSSIPPASRTDLPTDKAERSSLTERPLARHDNPLSRLVPRQYSQVKKSIANVYQLVRRAVGLLRREIIKAESKIDDWEASGRNPVSWVNRSLVHKPVPRFPLNSAFYRIGTLFSSPLDEGGTESCLKECVRCEDEVDLSEKAGNCFDMKVPIPGTPLELLRTSEKLEQALLQLDLEAPLPPWKTNWDVTMEMCVLLRVVLAILEATVNEVSSKSELHMTSANPNGDANYYPESSCDIELCTNLRKSFEKESSTASDRCIQAISLVANCIDEYNYVGDCTPAFLLPVTLDLVNIHSRINKAQETLACKNEMTIEFTERKSEQQEKLLDCVWRLIGAVSDHVISIQKRVLQSAIKRQCETETEDEESSKLESRLQKSWDWLNKLSKQVVVLCPCKKHDLFVYLLETFIQATEELCHFQQLVSISVKVKEKRLVPIATSSFQRLLIRCLARLSRNAEEVVSELKKSGIISERGFPQVFVARDKLAKVLTLLLPTTSNHMDSTILQFHRLSETECKSSGRLIPLTKEYLIVVLSIVRKNTPMTEAIKKRLKKLCSGLCDVHKKLKSSVEVAVNPAFDVEPSESSSADRGTSVHRQLISADDEQLTQVTQACIRPSGMRYTKLSAFAIPSSQPSNESPNDVLVPTDHDTTTCNTIEASQVVDAMLNVADGSLDRRLPSLPSIGAFGRANISAMRKVSDLGNGSLGQVSLVIFENSYAALKMSRCPDSNIAKERLERESKIHQRINSHANIVRFLGRAVQTDEHGEDQIMGIITEWCEFGDLNKAIKDAARVQELNLGGLDISGMKDKVGYELYKDWIKRLEVVCGITSGMVYMHDCHVVHRDLTSGNVLLEIVNKSNAIRAKVCDFERGYYLKDCEPIQRTNAPTNSAPWMGPEVLNHQKYGLQADVYSIGTILWQLMYLENPWTHLSKKCCGADEARIQSLLSKREVNLSISEFDAPEDVIEFPELVQLVKRAWKKDPESRPTMSELHKEVVEICVRMKERVRVEGNQTQVAKLHNGTL